MSIVDIIQSVVDESGRDDLDSDLGRRTILSWLNRYKLHLQRNKRIAFSEYTASISAVANIRTTDLPLDFLSSITIRRAQAGIIGITNDMFGNQFTIVKETTLHPWVDKEQFLDRFPINRSTGELYTGAFNDYMLQGGGIIWGPIPLESEDLFLDYYRILPAYDLASIIDDDFTTYYSDGLFYRCMEMTFTSWIPDDAKKKIWNAEKQIAESGIMKYDVLRKHPMESQLNLPDN